MPKATTTMAEIQRAISGAERTGKEVKAVEVKADGTIRLEFVDSESQTEQDGKTTSFGW